MRRAGDARRRAGALLVCGAVLSAACRPHPGPGGGRTPARPARNVIVLVVDGMSLPEIALLTQYRRHVHPRQPETAFERALDGREHGLADIYTVDPQGRTTLAVDSAASATQLACGVMSLPEVLGLDHEGRPCRSILEHAASLGMATGLVTDSRITDATPAAFAAKQDSRKAENDVAAAYVAGAAAGKIDVLLGGGARHFLPRAARVSQVPECAALPDVLVTGGARDDARDMIQLARAAGYRFVCDEAQLLAVPEAAGVKVLGTFAGGEYPAYPERAAVAGLPSLETAARKAIRILERDPDGFFVVIEAGSIDHAGHANDGAFLLRAMQEADRVLGFLLAYVDEHPDTLLVALGDHETGAPAFTYRLVPPVTTTLPSGTVHTVSVDYGDAVARYRLLERQTLSLGGMLGPIADRLSPGGGAPDPAYSLDQAVGDLIATVESHLAFTLTPEQARYVLMPPPGAFLVPTSRSTASPAPGRPTPDRLARVLADQTHLRWATGGHTSLPVIVIAAGPPLLTRQVRGYHHMTDVGRLLFEALGGAPAARPGDAAPAIAAPPRPPYSPPAHMF